jgi:hypothetical protein
MGFLMVNRTVKPSPEKQNRMSHLGIWMPIQNLPLFTVVLAAVNVTFSGIQATIKVLEYLKRR